MTRIPLTHSLVRLSLCLLALSVFAEKTPAQEKSARPCVADLRCEALKNPLGIDNPRPGFSWKMVDTRRGAKQTAYQILVADRPEELAADRGTLWDTGKVASNQNLHVVYDGKPLGSRQRGYWKVRIWDHEGRPTEFSQPAEFAVGLLKPSDWSARWISFSKEAAKTRNCPRFRKTFELEKIPEDARLYVATPGYFLVYVNGVQVGNDELMPTNAQFDKRIRYVTFDVKKLLKKGKNCVALWAGYGFYNTGYRGVEHDGPIVKAQLEMADQGDGKNLTTISTDQTWKWHESPLEGIAGDIHGGYGHGGERVDLRAAMPGWNTATADEADWKPCEVCEIGERTLSPPRCEPNRIVERVQPVAIERLDVDSWIVDFGFNLTGRIEWTPRCLSDGQEVMIEYVDHRDPNHCPERPFETFGQRDFVIASGEKGGTFRSYFNYRAFRYVIFYGMKNPPTLDDMAAYRIRTDFAKTASFQCSNETLNRIHDMMELTLEGLNVGGNLVDCSHVERWGYGGDGHSSTEAVCTLFNMQGVYANWHEAWRDFQRPNGDMPHAAPCIWNHGGGPIWCGFVLTTSWYLYEQYGDMRVLEQNYESSKKWLGFVEKHCKNNILQPWPSPKEPYRAMWLGDWIVPGANRDYEVEGSLESRMMVNNCFRIYCYDIMAKTAKALGHTDEAGQYAETAKRLRPIVHKRFYKPEKMSYAEDRQVDLHMGLMVDLMPESLKRDILGTLEENIVKRHQGHLCVGLVGTYFQMKQLIQDDRQDLLFLMHTQHDFPSYGYMLDNGATTTWEYWWGRRSRMHNCYNGPALWFYRGLAGIRPDSAQPGYRHFYIRPACLKPLTHVRAHYDSVQGRITSNWHRLDDRLIFEVVVPANTTATVCLPTDDSANVEESGKPIAIDGKTPGVRFLGIDPSGSGPRANFEVVAGSYLFSVKAPEKNAETKAYLKRNWP